MGEYVGLGDAGQEQQQHRVAAVQESTFLNDSSDSSVDGFATPLLGEDRADDCLSVDPNASDQLPTGPAYAMEISFWKHVVVCVAIGTCMGAIAYVYLECIERAQVAVFSDSRVHPEASTLAMVQIGHGEWIWVLFTSAMGLLVGMLKVLVKFPRNLRGFFAEIKDQHVDPIQAPKIVLISLVSLSAGVSLGPEAAMGSLGGGLAQAWSELQGLDKTMSQQNVVNAMAGAMGSLFPSPIISVTTMTEIGRVETMHHNYMRAVVMMTFAASASFGVFFALKNDAYLPLNPLSLTYQFKSGDTLKGGLIGSVAGLVAFLHIIIAGICQRLFLALQERVIKNERVATIISPVVGGALIGCLMVWAPLIIGSGSTQTAGMVKLAWAEQLDPTTFLISGFAKSLAFGVSKGSGFVGGAIFPMIFIGSALGNSLALFIEDREVLPLLLSNACFTAALPAALAPMPVSFLLMIAFSFNLGPSQATPIFFSCVVAHLTTCGFGLLLGLLGLAKKRRTQQP